MDSLLKRVLLRTIAFLLLIFLSPLLFVLVEYTEKDDVQEKHQLLHALYGSISSKCNLTMEEFNNFSNVAYEALNGPKPQWTYFTAMDFVSQAITTIGYGNITPQTPEGQLLCIFVSLLGIPISLLAFNSIGELIAKLVNAIVTKIEKKLLNRTEPKRVRTKSAVILFLLMVVLVTGNGLFFANIIGWTFVEGVYFSFVTYTTIGFGDYTIRKELSTNSSRNQQNKTFGSGYVIASIVTRVVIIFYIILGLCIVSSVINSIRAAIEERKCHPGCLGCLRRKIRNREDEEQNDTVTQTGNDYLTLEDFGFQKKTPHVLK